MGFEKTDLKTPSNQWRKPKVDNASDDERHADQSD
jgi:hypothetical protein